MRQGAGACYRVWCLLTIKVIFMSEVGKTHNHAQEIVLMREPMPSDSGTDEHLCLFKC